MLALFGLLELGRGIAAPLSVGGDWTLEFGSDAGCPAVAGLHQPAFNISQSGTQALITWNDGRSTAGPAFINGSALTAKSLDATITGKGAGRILEGKLSLEGCAPVAFRAVRQAPAKKKGE